MNKDDHQGITTENNNNNNTNAIKRTLKNFFIDFGRNMYF